jgi:hypothetical protein
MADDYMQFAAGAILLDKLGSELAVTAPAGELAIVLDLGGRLNKQTEEAERRFLMRPEQAAELLADLSLTLGRVPGHRQMIEQAFEREKQRRSES